MTNPSASASTLRRRIGTVALAIATLTLASLGLAGQIDPADVVGSSIFIFH